MSPQEKQMQFIMLAEQEVFPLRQVLDPQTKIPHSAILYQKLIIEEATELSESLEVCINSSYEDERRNAVVALTRECADLLYVLCGFCNTLGIPLESAFNEVHAANMTKGILNEEGDYELFYREDGKVLKPEGWQPPNIDRVLDNQLILDSFS
jgi:NTP pyrophosphatase (non-canonical NTP hydrolase)